MASLFGRIASNFDFSLYITCVWRNNGKKWRFPRAFRVRAGGEVGVSSHLSTHPYSIVSWETIFGSFCEMFSFMKHCFQVSAHRSNIKRFVPWACAFLEIFFNFAQTFLMFFHLDFSFHIFLRLWNIFSHFCLLCNHLETLRIAV